MSSTNGSFSLKENSLKTSILINQAISLLFMQREVEKLKCTSLSTGERKEKGVCWIVEFIPAISKNLDTHFQEFPLGEQLVAADVAAIFNAAINVYEETSDPWKVELVGNALVNSFKIAQLEDRLTLGLFSTLRKTSHYEILMLKRFFRQKKVNTIGIEKQVIDNLYTNGILAGDDDNLIITVFGDKFLAFLAKVE